MTGMLLEPAISTGHSRSGSALKGVGGENAGGIAARAKGGMAERDQPAEPEAKFRPTAARANIAMRVASVM